MNRNLSVHWRRAWMVLLLLSTLRAPWAAGQSTPAAPSDQVTQVSVINALMLGQYDGVMPLARVLELGDLGIGTVDHLDGELLILDGQAFQVRGDGQVVELDAERSTPFVTVKRFQADGEIVAPSMDSLTALEQWLDGTIEARNTFLAVRIEAEFPALTLRSVRRQEPPYRPLADVAKDQSVWNRRDVRGTLIGFRCPDWTAGLNVPGYHWHFLSDDRQIGGHVLACRFESARVRYDVSRDWNVRLPATAEFERAEITRDLRKDLDAVERARPGAAKPGPQKP